MKTKILQYLALACLLITVFSSCRKESFGGKENSQAGKTYVWIEQAPEYNQFFAPFTNIALVKMFTIRRDPANKADLQKAITVTLTATSQQLLDSLKGADAGYTTLFGSGIYTDVTAADLATGGQFVGSQGITKTATGYTVNFAAGEFAKNFFIHVDGSQLDPSAKYVLPLVITNFGGFTGKTGYSSIFATLGVKNKYDGTYTAVGAFTDVANGALSDANGALPVGSATAPMQYEFRTTSANSVQMVVNNYGLGGVNYYMAISNNGTLGVYGNWDPIFTFDLSSNAVTAVTNYYVNNSQGRTALIDAASTNVYDPGAKTITVKFYMLQPGAANVGPDNKRVTFTYKYTYIGPR